jgi:hypothetical protein
VKDWLPRRSDWTIAIAFAVLFAAALAFLLAVAP